MSDILFNNYEVIYCFSSLDAYNYEIFFTFLMLLEIRMFGSVTRTWTFAWVPTCKVVSGSYARIALSLSSNFLIKLKIRFTEGWKKS